MPATHPQYKETTRKVNDLWALALYIVFMTFVTTYVVLTSKAKSYSDLASHFDMKVLIFTFVCGFLSFGIHLAALLYFPAPAMHVSCILLPVISVALAIYVGHVYGIIVSFVFSILALVMYLLYLRKHIKYAAQVARSATQVICTNIFSVICVLVLFLTGWAAMFYVYIVVTMGLNNQEKIISLICECLAVSWTFFVVFYSLRVFIASIVVIHFLFRTVSSSQRAADAIKNWLYALGSICFGALLIALITVLRMLVDRERRRSGAVGGFFYAILLLLIDILQDIVNFSNEWAYCHIALTGKGYVESTKESWRILSQPGNRAITNSIAITTLLNFISIIFALIYSFGLWLIIKDTNAPLKEVMIPALIFLVASYLFFSCGVSAIFDSGVKSLLFTYSMFPGEVREQDAKLADAIEDQKKMQY